MLKLNTSANSNYKNCAPNQKQNSIPCQSILGNRGGLVLLLGFVATCSLLLTIHNGDAGSSPATTISNRISRGASGSGWHWQNPLPQGNSLHGASLVNANTATLVGDYGTIVRTTDGGNSWTIQTSGTTQTLWAVSFTDALTGTAVGDGARLSGRQMATTGLLNQMEQRSIFAEGIVHGH